MIFICDANNNITPLFANNIHQGELNANHILLLAPYPSDATVTMRVILPNGLIIPTEPNYFKFAKAVIPDGLNLNLDTVALNAWSIRLDAAITQYAGKIEFQIFATLPIDVSPFPIKYATSAEVAVISRGVPSVGDPPQWDEVTPEQILEILGKVDQANEAAAAAEENAQYASERAENAAINAAEASEAAENAVPIMTELDKEMLKTFGGVIDGVAYDNPVYFFNDINWQVLLRCNRAYVQAYDSDDEFRLKGSGGKGLYALKALIRYGGIAFTYDDGSANGLRIDTQIPRYPWMRKDEWIEKWRAAHPGEEEQFSDDEIISQYPPAWTDYAYMSTLCERRPDGRIRIPRTFNGLSASEASQLCAPKDYVDTKANNAKTEAIAECIPIKDIAPVSDQTSAIVINGSGKYVNIQVAANSALASTVVQRNANGVVKTNTLGSADDSVNVSYANNNYVNRKSALPNTSNRFVYTRQGDTERYIMLTKNPSSTDTIPYRDANGKVRVGTPTYTDSDDDSCAVPLSMFKTKLAELKAEIIAELGG